MLASHLYLDPIMKLFTVLNLNQQHVGKHADVTWHWTGVPVAIFQSSLRTFSCSKAGHQTSIAATAALKKNGSTECRQISVATPSFWYLITKQEYCFVYALLWLLPKLKYLLNIDPIKSSRPLKNGKKKIKIKKSYFGWILTRFQVELQH